MASKNERLTMGQQEDVALDMHGQLDFSGVHDDVRQGRVHDHSDFFFTEKPVK